jgi:DNA adenine methylase
MAKPFIKWVGGKTKLLPTLHQHFPKQIECFHEPFLGGGSVLFSLNAYSDIKVKHINSSDLNADLINTYVQIQHHMNKVIDILKTYENTEEFYYELRNSDAFFFACDALHRAAKFIYLNKTCFNGLYRTNKKGKFNVPFGKYKNPNFCNVELLKECSQYLNDNDILFYVQDFEGILNYINVSEKDFFYFDPPYVPLNKTSNFTSYTKDAFGESKHMKLKEVCDFVHMRNSKFLQSNSDTEFVRELYKDYEIIEVQAPRRINCKGNLRGNVTELLIKNY